MEYDFNKITPCGGDCSDCKYYMNRECGGCLKTDGKRADVWEGDCSIYECCKKNKVKFCGLCRDFPCKDFHKITQWDKDALNKHKEAARKYEERKKEQ